MNGNISSPELPIFGNKVLAVNGGVLDLHGKVVTPTWTELEFTANVGDTSITLREAIYGWEVGNTIVIAPTGYSNLETEERVIKDIDNTDPNKPIISFDKPLEFKHYAGI